MQTIPAIILLIQLLLQLQLGFQTLVAHYPLTQTAQFSATAGQLPKSDLQGNIDFTHQNYNNEANSAFLREYNGTVQDNYLRGDVSYLGTGDFTIAMWYYTETTDNLAALFDLEFHHISASCIKLLQVVRQSIKINNFAYYKGQIYIENYWNLIAVTKQARTILVYTNGEFVASVDIIPLLDISYPTQLTIGYGTGLNQMSLKGSDLRLYDTALSVNDIRLVQFGSFQDGTVNLEAFYPFNGNLRDKTRQNSNLQFKDDVIKGYSSPDRNLKETSSLMIPYYDTDLLLPTRFLGNNNQTISLTFWLKGRQRQGAIISDELIQILTFLDSSDNILIFIQDEQVKVGSATQVIESILKSKWNHIALLIDTINLNFEFFINGVGLSLQSFSNSNILREVDKIKLVRIPNIQHSTSNQGYVQLDDLRIYSSILTKGDILNIKYLDISQGNQLHSEIFAYYTYQGHGYSDIYITDDDGSQTYAEAYEEEFLNVDFNSTQLQARFIQNPVFHSELQLVRFPELEQDIPLSFSFWVKARNPNNNHKILTLQFQGPYDVILWSQQYQLSGSIYQYNGADQNLFENDWVHVSMVYDPDSTDFITIFKNGVQFYQLYFDGTGVKLINLFLGHDRCILLFPQDECGLEIFNFKVYKIAMPFTDIPTIFSQEQNNAAAAIQLELTEHCQNVCSVCDSSDNCIGDCLQNYYMDSHTSMCESCDPICNGCDNSPTSCQKCQDSLKVPPLCSQCIPGYYFNTNNSACEICSPQCGTCSGSADSCVVQCETGCATCDQTGKCTNCNVGSVLTQNKQCLDCHKKCFSCSQDQDTCTECAKGKFRSLDLQQNCGCMQGYFDNGELDCVIGSVLNCQIYDESGNCIQCQNALLDPQDCKTLKQSIGRFSFFETVQRRPIGNQDTQKDLQERENKCMNAKFRNQQWPCYCIQGYHDQNNQKYDCEPCHYTCNQCSDYQMCTECDLRKKRVLNEFSNQCECIKGYKENKKSLSCQKCYYYEKKCVQQCPPNTIQDEKLQICRQIQYLSQSQYYMFWMSFIVVCISLVVFAISFKLGTYIKKSQLCKKIDSHTQYIKDQEAQKLRKNNSIKSGQSSSNSGGSDSISI